MTEAEYLFLKNWTRLPLKRQHASPMPANDLIQQVVTDGFLLPISRSDSSDRAHLLVVGYEITTAGLAALKQFELRNKILGT